MLWLLPAFQSHLQVVCTPKKNCLGWWVGTKCLSSWTSFPGALMGPKVKLSLALSPSWMSAPHWLSYRVMYKFLPTSCFMPCQSPSPMPARSVSTPIENSWLDLRIYISRKQPSLDMERTSHDSLKSQKSKPWGRHSFFSQRFRKRIMVLLCAHLSSPCL